MFDDDIHMDCHMVMEERECKICGEPLCLKPYRGMCGSCAAEEDQRRKASKIKVKEGRGKMHERSKPDRGR